MDYEIINTEFDSDNVNVSFEVNHGRTEHWLNLTQKTYFTKRIADGISTQITPIVWDDNKPTVNRFIELEINRLNNKILLQKTRLYEVYHFKNFLKISPDETPQSIQQSIEADQASLSYLKNYVP